MKRTLLILWAMLAAATLRAQTLDDFKRQLAQPAFDGARIEVTEHGDAAAAMARAAEAVSQRTFSGWRISLFFGNSPSARAEAARVKEEFETAFPGDWVDISYENPYFKVTAGACATSEEAIILLERYRKVFPKAFLTRETLTAADLIREGEAADSLGGAALPDAAVRAAGVADGAAPTAFSGAATDRSAQ